MIIFLYLELGLKSVVLLIMHDLEQKQFGFFS